MVAWSAWFCPEKKSYQIGINNFHSFTGFALSCWINHRNTNIFIENRAKKAYRWKTSPIDKFNPFIKLSGTQQVAIKLFEAFVFKAIVINVLFCISQLVIALQSTTKKKHMYSTKCTYYETEDNLPNRCSRTQKHSICHF